MSVWAMVPIKPLNRAKSRLASVLPPEQRASLALAMLHHNLAVLTSTPLLAGVLVISRDTKALAAARAVGGVQTLQESGTPELNSALKRAARLLISWKVEAALILPADVPLINREEVEAIIRLGEEGRQVILVPDRKKDGTNAIFVRPPDVIEMGFGEGSFLRHQASAQEVACGLQVYESERLGLDVDTPEDLADYVKLAAKYGQSPIQY